MASDDEPNWIPSTVIELGVADSTGSLTIMCNYVRFYIDVDAADLKGDSPQDNLIYDEFLSLCEDEYQFEEWATVACLPTMRRRAPKPSQDRVFSLEDYFRPPTVSLRLETLDGKLVAEELPVTQELLNSFIPHLDLTEAQAAIPEMETLPRFSASEFDIIPKIESDGTDYCEMPIRVRKGKDGQLVAFKTAFDRESMLREIKAYAKFEEARGQTLCSFPIFHGVVTLGDKVLGFIIEYIDHKGTLSYHAPDASGEDRRRWFEQITQALKSLHNLGLTWGDVKHDNVLIDMDGNAHVIDFGGGFSPDWVDSQLADTEAGDLQGLARLKAFLKC